MNTHILIVDDDRALRIALGKALRRKGFQVSEAEDGKQAMQPFLSGKINDLQIDVCLLDLKMPNLDGLGLLRKTIGRQFPVVVLSGHGSIHDAVEAMRLKASDFLQKPIDADILVPVLEQAINQSKYSHNKDIIGESEELKSFQLRLKRAAKSEETILLLGETGVGKELSAQKVHCLSSFSKGPFIAFNAACIPKDLFESELFGHTKGAFTGALNDRQGLLEEAAGGTLFIDEIGDLPLDAQAKLLRAIEEKHFRPVGSNQEISFRARICAATHRNLEKMVQNGTFRADLYYRLNVLPLSIPPLRERQGDIQLISEYWLDRLSGSGTQYTLEEDALQILTDYSFPGNIRELINIIKRAVILSEQYSITGEYIKDLLNKSPFTIYQAEASQLSNNSQQEINKISTNLSEHISSSLKAGERITLEELEKAHICSLLDEINNVSEVARIIGIDRRTLQRKIAAWGLRDEKNKNYSRV